MSIRETFTYPTEPNRLCLCGVQGDGSFIRECPNCRTWRQAQPTAVGVPNTGAYGTFGRPVTMSEYRKKLYYFEDKLEDLLALRDTAKLSGKLPRELCSELRTVRQQLQRIRKQITRLETLESQEMVPV